MKTTLGIFALLSLSAIACGAAPPPSAPTSSKTTINPPQDEPLPSGPLPASADPRFPAGRGTTLVVEQLRDVEKDAIVRDIKAPFAARVAKARELLGDQGETLPDGSVAFRAVSARGFASPFGCHEYVLYETKPSYPRAADHKLCGLPYIEDPTAVAPITIGARVTIAKLKEVLAGITGLIPHEAKERAKAKLYSPDQADGDDFVWLGLGGRDENAPVTCHALKAGSATRQPRIEKLPLSACAISWPPPQARFERGPDVPPIAYTQTIESCVAKCGTKEICVLERISGQNVSVVPDGDTLRGTYPDGRPAPVTLNATCAPIPTSCSPLTSDCFFSRATFTPGLPPPPMDAGPCQADTNVGHGFSKTKNGSPYITCMQRDKPVNRGTPPQTSRVALKVGATTSFPLDTIASYTAGTTQVVSLTSNKNALVVQAKKQGSATLVLVDKQGARTSYVIDVK